MMAEQAEQVRRYYPRQGHPLDPLEIRLHNGITAWRPSSLRPQTGRFGSSPSFRAASLSTDSGPTTMMTATATRGATKMAGLGVDYWPRKLADADAEARRGDERAADIAAQIRQHLLERYGLQPPPPPKTPSAKGSYST